MMNRDQHSLRTSLQSLFARKTSRRAPCRTTLRIEPLESRLLLHANNGPHPEDPTYDLNSFEIYANLSIYVDSQQVTIPSGVGDASTGEADIHTHDDTGEIHIHPQTPQSDFIQLGDFFTAWDTNPATGSPAIIALSNTQVFDNSVDNDTRLQMFVNGTEVTDEFAEYQIHDDDNIVLVYGSNPVISLDTNAGSIPLELLANEAPNTVDNFLSYVNGGADGSGYAGTILHRSIPDLAIIGGGYRPISLTTTELLDIRGPLRFQPVNNFSRHIPELDGITNERSPDDRSNSFGTLAGVASRNGLTSGFLFNTADNAHLDDRGFTVFAVALGTATPGGQPLANATLNEIAAFTTVDVDRSNDNGGTTLSPDFDEVPYTPVGELVAIQSVSGMGTVRGRVFADENQDGELNNGEAGLAGRTVFSDANGNGLLDIDDVAVVTDANGDYVLYLEPGRHTIRQLPVPWENQTTPLSPDVFMVDVEIGRESDAARFGNFASSNPTPTAIDDAFTGFAENSVDNFLNVLSNDQFVGDVNETLRITDVGTTSQGGTVVINGDGDNLAYTPAPNFSGTETFTYTVTDRTNVTGLTSQATVTVTVEAANSPPAATDDAFTVREDSTNNILNVLSNDSSQPDVGETLIIIATGNSSAGGTATVASDGLSVLYTPARGRRGDETFTYTISDGNGGEATANVTVTSASDNNPPTAIDDTFTVPENSTGNTLNVLANDSTQPDVGETLTIVSAVNASAGGTVTVASNGLTILYTPAAGRRGDESFTYTIADSNGAEATANVTVTIDPINVPPTPVADTFTITGGTSDNTLDVLANDSNAPDPPGEPLTVAAIDTTETSGTVTIATDNNSVLYTPLNNFRGTDTFTYTLSDGTSESTPVAVTINVIGEVASGSLSGYVFIDANNNNVRESSEMGVPGVVITLAGETDSGSSVEKSELTDGNGAYRFDALEPGTYQLTKRQSAALNDGQQSTTVSGATATTSHIENIVLADGESATENNFGEVGLQPEFISILWFLSSTPPASQMLRETVALAEEINGDDALANTIRNGGGDVPDLNSAPVANNDSYTIDSGSILTVSATTGVLANDVDADNDALTATVVARPGNGSLTLNTDGSFTYEPNANFSGTDTFTYTASDGSLASGIATVAVTVEAVDDPDPPNTPFGPVTPGSFEDVGVLGIRTDLQPGAPPLNADHVTTPVDYSEYSNPPTYGPHHAFLRDAQGNSVTPRATGVYQTEQPDEDLLHNLEHGHVWISYNPTRLSSDDIGRLEQFVIDGGTDTGVILTPRAGNASAIAAASWARLLTLDSYDATELRNFVETNRGKSPEGFIPAGQKANTAASETVDDGLDHGRAPEDPNAAPSASGDSFSTDRGITLNISAAQGVLANDSDPENDNLTASVVSNPTDGTLTLNRDGSFTYAPDAGFTGTDTFTYRASDSALSSNIATVSITVNATNTAPSASNDAYSIGGGQTLTVDVATGVLINDSDPDGDSLIAAVASNPTGGTLTLNQDGSFNYQPNADFTGNDLFTYTASDGELSSNVASVSITVSSANAAPSAANDVYSVAEGQVLTVDAAAGVLNNDSDPDGDRLTVAVVSNPTGGTLTLNQDGSFTYTPNANFTGVDAFDYSASDGSLTANGSVEITVNPGSSSESSSTTAAPSQDTTLVENPTGAAGNGAGNAFFVGTTNRNANALRRGLVAFDLADTGIPQGATVTNVELTMNMSKTNFGNSDVSLHRVSTAWGEGAAAGGGFGAPAEAGDATWIHSAFPSSNWNTPGGDFVAAASATTSVGGNGPYVWSSPQMTADVQAWIDNPSDNFGWIVLGDETTPSAKKFDSRETLDASNQPRLAVTYTVPVEDPNTAPSASNDSFSTSEGSTLNVPASQGVLANDSDAENDDLTATVVSSPANGTLALSLDGAFTYAPTSGFAGSDSFTYRVHDGKLFSSPVSVSITVESTNGAPAASNDSYSVDGGQTLTVNAASGVLNNDSDPENDAMTATVASNPSNGSLTLSQDGSFTYVPNANFTGVDSFTYRASDGDLSSSIATVSIAVNSTNSRPSASNDSYSVNEGETLTVAAATGVLSNDSDPENDVLTAAIVANPTDGTLTLNSDGSFTYTPDAGFTGTDTFTYQSDDGELRSEIVTVSITVNATNSAPSASNDVYSVNEGLRLTVNDVTGVLANDSDADNDNLSATEVAGPSNGTLTLNSDGSFAYTPNSDFTGVDSFTYLASDGELSSNVTSVSITVNSTNVAPSASSDSYTTSEGQALSIDAATGVLTNDSDPEGDGLNVSIVSNPTNGTVTLNADGSFDYLPNANFTGADMFTYQASDGELSSNIGNVTITVGPAQSATLTPFKDTTLYEFPNGGNANGAGQYFFAGRTAEPGNSRRRGLVAFDVTADIPDGAMITDVTLQLFMSRTIVRPYDVTLYRVTSDWNQGSTDQTGEEGGAHVTPPSTGDATWIHSEFPNAFWNTPGGDFEQTPLATTSVGGTREYFQWNSAELVASVQDWLDNPSQNFGWILLGNETAISAKRFDSSENPDPATRPSLTVTYIVPDAAAASSAQLSSVVAPESTVANEANSPPVTGVDHYSVDEDQTLSVSPVSGILSNDSDPESDVLTAKIDVDVANGQLNLRADGSFTYTPNADYNGTDSFSYTASDGQTSTIGSVVISVNPIDEPAQASSVTIVASQDTTLIESADGESGNGAGTGFFAGKNNGNAFTLRRGLVEFDLENAGIPDGATILDVALILNMSKTNSGAAEFSIHRVTEDWGEGASSGGGSGGQALTNDATWFHTHYANGTWNSPGGDFATAASATTLIDGVGSYLWSSPQLITDIQSWLDDPLNNFGWIIIGDETAPSSKRFDSRENANAENRPRLRIDFEA